MLAGVLVLVSVLLPHGFTFAGDVDPQHVDALFAVYGKPHSPGCSLGVIRNGSFIHQNSYGEASLELGVPLSSRSVFYMASVSKQFTAAAVVIAAEQGYLSLDDDVRKFIPELPDYGRPITLREVLHQTSGIRDFFTLIELAGRDAAGLSSDDVLRLIARQKGLNNAPGREFVYSNSNYFLLGLVIKRATGKTLAEYANENIFVPLGMKSTLFYDNKSIVVPNRVAAYEPGKDGSFSVDWSTQFDLVGSGGLMSNVDDLLLWDRNFYSNKLGKGTLVKELQTAGKLSDGHVINYGLGLWLTDYRGLKIEEHSGGTLGYRTELLRFPEQKFSVALLCNIANADVEGLARKVSDLYLGKELKEDENAASSTHSFPDPAPFVGTYLDPRTHTIFTFSAKDGNLVAWGANLRRLGANEFSDLVGNPILFQPENGNMTATLTLQGEKFFVGHRVPPIKLTESALQRYAGTFTSQELQTSYTIAMLNQTLVLKFGDHPPVTLTPIARNEFQAGDLGTLVFDFSAVGRLSRLILYSQRARGMTFHVARREMSNRVQP